MGRGSRAEVRGRARARVRARGVALGLGLGLSSQPGLGRFGSGSGRVGLGSGSVSSSPPERPTARPPASVIELAICLLMLPHSTISAASIVALSVTRSPATNSLLISSFFSIALIWGPPPWTTTSRTPSDCISAQSAANDFDSSGSVMACPPYFTTTTSPAQAATRPSWLGSGASSACATMLQRRWASGRYCGEHRSAALHAANSATRVILILLSRGSNGDDRTRALTTLRRDLVRKYRQVARGGNEEHEARLPVCK